VHLTRYNDNAYAAKHTTNEYDSILKGRVPSTNKRLEYLGKVVLELNEGKVTPVL
jgi:dsRNA-specific ribonuclease